jgi:hypothetical protein
MVDRVDQAGLSGATSCGEALHAMHPSCIGEDGVESLATRGQSRRVSAECRLMSPAPVRPPKSESSLPGEDGQLPESADGLKQGSHGSGRWARLEARCAVHAARELHGVTTIAAMHSPRRFNHRVRECGPDDRAGVTRARQVDAPVHKLSRSAPRARDDTCPIAPDLTRASGALLYLS